MVPADAATTSSSSNNTPLQPPHPTKDTTTAPSSHAVDTAAAKTRANDAQQQHVTVSQAPSHILQDGRFVILPDPSPLERRRFMERSIARHGLLQEYLQQSTTNDDNDNQKDKDPTDNNNDKTPSLQGLTNAGDDKEDNGPTGAADQTNDDDKDDKPLQVHPLVLASARLQNDGINELNRSINLATLVQSGEYFGLSNIVADSALELAMTEAAAAASVAAAAAKAVESETPEKTGDTTTSTTTGGTGPAASSQTTSSTSGATSTAAATAPTNNINNTSTATNSSTTAASKSDMHHSQRIAALYILKRKHAQFRQSALQFQQHQERLQMALVAEQRPLNRLRQLRPHWRLVAPEHGTRAAPHAARPTEVLAADVDLYHSSQPGRLARRVPRYATVELKANYQVEHDVVQWQQKHGEQKKTNKKLKTGKEHGVEMDATNSNSQRNETALDITMTEVDTTIEKEKETKAEITETTTSSMDQNDYSENALWTRAEPFAIADPTLGKIDADFDPSMVAMLTLEFAIEKPSIGLCTSACLEPFVVATHLHKKKSSQDDPADDSQVLVALQHSLFCSKMFDSIRREVASDTEEVGQVRTTASQSERSTVWTWSKNEQQFLPPPGSMVKGDLGLGQPVSVVHCHEGEVMVQLDCEFTLRIKLVEANTTASHSSSSPTPESTKPLCDTGADTASMKDSNHDRRRLQLLALCRSLMLYAQEIYHSHSLQQDKIRKQEQEEKAAQPASAFALKRKEREETSPRILQNCICLGSKMLMERRVRSTLKAVQLWVSEREQQRLGTVGPQPPIRQLQTEWLSLSALDPHAHFTTFLKGTKWYMDVHLSGDRLTVTTFEPTQAVSSSDGTTKNHQQDHSNMDSASDQFRKVDFHSELELELFLKRSLGRQLQITA